MLIHGFPLDGRSWDKQERALLEAGYRVISYDRRGFGESSRTTVGFDYDTFADDLHALLEHLDLRDVALVGFSMGTGEVVRYLGRHGSGRVSKAALLASVPPYLLKTDDNPEGVDREVFEGIKAAIVADRPAYFKDFLDNFFNVDVLGGTRISEPAWQAAFAMALQAGPHAVHACVDTWLTDFRDDLAKIDVPVLLVHGDSDRILPYDVDRRPAARPDPGLDASSPSRTARTTSPGPTPRSSTPPCSTSSRPEAAGHRRAAMNVAARPSCERRCCRPR